MLDNAVEPINFGGIMSGNGNKATLASRYLDLLNSEKRSDCSFFVGKESSEQKLFKCHKAILSSASPVFDAMFYGSLPEKCDSAIPLPDIDPNAFRMLLEFIYCGEVYQLLKTHTFKLFGKLYIISDYYDVPKFREYLKNYVMSSTTTWDFSSTLEVLNSACSADSNNLVQFCLEKLKQDQFYYLGKEDIFLITIKTLAKIVDYVLRNYDRNNVKLLNENLFITMFQTIDKYAEVNNLFQNVCCSCKSSKVDVGKEIENSCKDGNEENSEKKVNIGKLNINKALNYLEHENNKECREFIKIFNRCRGVDYVILKEKAIVSGFNINKNTNCLENENKKEFREFFKSLIRDRRIGKQEFCWGPANSKLLCKKEGFDIAINLMKESHKNPRPGQYCPACLLYYTS